MADAAQTQPPLPAAAPAVAHAAPLGKRIYAWTLLVLAIVLLGVVGYALWRLVKVL